MAVARFRFNSIHAKQMLMSKPIDLNLINTFLVVTESQSYTKAAEQLGVTQPAVSASIRRLEQASNKKLFVKSGRSIELTHTARELLPQLRQALSIIDNAMTKPQSFKAYCCDLPLLGLSPIDNVIFHESTQDAGELCDFLYHRKADIIIGSIGNKPTSIIVEDLHQEPFVIIGRADHPRLSKRLDIDAFHNEKHCVLSSTWSVETEHEAALNVTIKANQIEVVTSSYLGVLTNVAQRDCLGVVPLSVAKKWGGALNIRYFQSPFPSGQFTFQIAYHKRHANCAEHRAMRRVLKERLSLPLSSQHYS